jgi:hypothetical protein
VLRLTGTERAVAEIVAVAEHVASLTAAAAAFQLASDIPSPARNGNHPLVAPVDEEHMGEVASTLREIREWSVQALGVEHTPVIWRVLAHQPRLLETTWRKDRLILSAGRVDELVKSCVALAVAQFRQSPYCISYFTHLLRMTHHLDDRALVELAGDASASTRSGYRGRRCRSRRPARTCRAGRATESHERRSMSAG